MLKILRTFITSVVLPLLLCIVLIKAHRLCCKHCIVIPTDDRSAANLFNTFIRNVSRDFSEEEVELTDLPLWRRWYSIGNRCERSPRQLARRRAIEHTVNLRSDGSSAAAAAAAALVDDTVDPNCPRCGQAPQTLEHWLDCRGTVQARLEIFGTTEALPVSTLSNCSGQIGRTGKTHCVTDWCARHHHQQQQQAAAAAAVPLYNRSPTDAAVAQTDFQGLFELSTRFAMYAVQGLRKCRASVGSSVCPSISSSGLCTPLRRVCCCGPGGQEISIDCCTAGAQQQTASRVTLSLVIWRRKLNMYTCCEFVVDLIVADLLQTRWCQLPSSRPDVAD